LAQINLGSGIPRKRTRRLDLAAQPLSVHIETVPPSRRAVLKEYVPEVDQIAQGLDHGAASTIGTKKSYSPHIPSPNVACRRRPPRHFEFYDFVHH
jgi:hypothetical protein